MPLVKSDYMTPIGSLTIILEQGVIVCCEFSDHAERVHRHLDRHYKGSVIEDTPLPAMLKDALDAYFSGDHGALDNQPVRPVGTEFQQKVWHALRTIPAGDTKSYADFAKSVGTGARAVGTTNGRNPVCLFLPCHRVIGANGSLTGYAGGLDRKHWLLSHEGAILV